MAKKRILVLGQNGQVGSAIFQSIDSFDNADLIFTNRELLDLEKIDTIEYQIKEIRPDIVINAAAYTAVDKAENDILKCYKINTFAVGQIAKICNEIGAVLIHYSSDYVYHSHYGTPLNEAVSTTPKGIYALSKLQGEKHALFFNNKTIVIRTSWVYHESGNNFVKTMIKLGKEKTSLNIINDQHGAPTYATDIAKVTANIINQLTLIQSPWGVYNFANEGSTTWFEFANEIFKLKNIDIHTIPITTKEYNALAPRPLWSVLDLSKIKSNFQIEIPEWQNRLKSVISLF